MKNDIMVLPEMDIGISTADRQKIADGLSALLADSYTLYLMTHNFHWNVTGPQFNSLHNMFMDQYTEQWNALDIIAERIRALRPEHARLEAHLGHGDVDHAPTLGGGRSGGWAVRWSAGAARTLPR